MKNNKGFFFIPFIVLVFAVTALVVSMDGTIKDEQQHTIQGDR